MANWRHVKHIWTVMTHKWFVFLAGLKTKAPLWRLITHDLSKLSPAEFCGYADYFHTSQEWKDREVFRNTGKYGLEALIPYGELASDRFSLAWLHHQNANPHHWEHWLRRPKGTPAPMPEWAVREMVADWMGAGRVYGGEWPEENDWKWFCDNVGKMRFHGDTVVVLAKVLSEVGCPMDVRGKLFTYGE